MEGTISSIASTSFSETLFDYVLPLARADFDVSFEELNLPREIKDAIIVYQGSLTEDYQYLSKNLDEVHEQ